MSATGTANGRPAEKDWVSPGQVSSRPRASWPGIAAAIWPTQRTLLLGCLGAVVALIAGLFWYRQWSSGILAEITEGPLCGGGAALDSPTCTSALIDARYLRLQTPSNVLLFACAALTAGGGVLLGVAAFARDFEQRTQVLLLSQSISRARWWTARTVMVAAPWVLAMIALGATSTLSLRDDPFPGNPMDPARFYFSPLSLPLIALVSVALGATVGIFLRSTLAALLVAALLVALIVVGAELARPHLVPTTRLVSAMEVGGFRSVPDGSWFRETGYLDAAGDEVQFRGACQIGDGITEPTQEQYEQAMRDCYRAAGIVSGYTDVVEPQWFTPLRLLWSGVLVVVSALALLTGFLRIRRRVL